MPKRAPIEYKPQFGGGVFRAQDIVESERAALEHQTVPQEPETDGATEQPNAQSDVDQENNRTVSSKTVERSNGRTVERSNIEKSVPSGQQKRTANVQARARVRHSFDVGQDQLHALAEIQARIFSETGKKPKLGDLVQEALDLYITRQGKRSNERTVERTNGRETLTDSLRSGR